MPEFNLTRVKWPLFPSKVHGLSKNALCRTAHPFTLLFP